MLTAALLVLMLSLPGVAFAAAGWPVAGRWRLAGVPAVSILCLSWVAWGSGRMGAAPSPVLLLTLATVVGALLGLGVRLLHRRTPPGRAATTREVRRRALDGVAAVGGVLAAATVGYQVWTTTARWYDSVPSYWDSTWHGYVMSFVARTGIVDPEQLVRLDPHVAGWLDYYPTGLHLPVGLALGLSGEPVTTGYNVSQLLFAVVVMPAGIAALVRALGVRSRSLLFLAPFVIVLAYPVQARLIDIASYQVGIALAPAALAAMVTASRSQWRSAPTLVAALSLSGVFLVQPSVVVIIGIIGTCYALSTVSRRRRPAALRTIVGLTSWVVVSVVLVLPWVLLAMTHASATLSFARPATGTYLQAIPPLFQYNGSDTVWTHTGVLLLSVVVLLVHRSHRWVVVAMLVFGYLYVVAVAETSRLRQVLTGLWFTDWFRLAPVFWLLAFLVIVLALDIVLKAARQATHGQVRAALAGTVAVTVLLLAWGGQTSADATRAKMTKTRSTALVTPQARLAFKFLAGRVPTGDRVLNDWSDGSGWMYALADVNPLILYVTSTREAERNYLLTHFSELGRNKKVDRLLRKYRVRFVYTSDTRIPAATYRLTLPSDMSRLRNVYDEAGVRVYQILPTPPIWYPAAITSAAGVPPRSAGSGWYPRRSG